MPTYVAPQFKAELPVGDGLQYTFLLYPNPMARAETALPAMFMDSFRNTRAAGAGASSARINALYLPCTSIREICPIWQSGVFGDKS